MENHNKNKHVRPMVDEGAVNFSAYELTIYKIHIKGGGSKFSSNTPLQLKRLRYSVGCIFITKMLAITDESYT